jgi:hypothetical protein
MLSIRAPVEPVATGAAARVAQGGVLVDADRAVTVAKSVEAGAS